MTILSGDVKLVPSEVMDDVPEGGGAPANDEIRDGISNALMPDISELDRAGGRVNLRKTFIAVHTDTTDGYYGAHVIVSDAPDDPRVHITLFSTNDTFDTRDAAKGRLEAYMAPSSEWNGFLLENHISGQRAIQIFQMPNTPLPPVGRVLRLVYHEGLGDERAQYVRLTRVSAAERTYVGDDGRAYQAMVVTADLSDALRFDLPGTAPNRFFDRRRNGTATTIRDTVVADAASYYGAAELTRPLVIGDVAAAVSTIFAQLVPSAQTEIPLVDYTAGGFSAALVASADGTVTYNTNATFDNKTVLSVGTAIYPGTLVINAVAVLVDNAGQLMDGATAVGTVNYARGEVRLAATAPTYGGSKTVSFRPAAAPLELADTAMIFVTAESRGYNVALTIPEPPTPGSLLVSYRTNGKWYDLRDNGSGQLKGTDPLYGAGTISYVTGAASVTLGALPDVGSAIMFAWGSVANYINRSAMPVVAPTVTIQLDNTGVTPESFKLTWNDGEERQVEDLGGFGKLIGSATGTIDYITGLVKLKPNNLPAGGQAYRATYTYGEPITETFPAPARDLNGGVPIEVANGYIIPGTVKVVWNVLIENYDVISTTPPEMVVLPRVDPYKTTTDVMTGKLLDQRGETFGDVDYSMGRILIAKPDFTMSVPWPRYSTVEIGVTAEGGKWKKVYRSYFKGFDYKPAAAIFPHDESGVVTVTYRSSVASNNADETYTADGGGLTFDLTSNFAEAIVPGAVTFKLGSDTYFDRNGALFYKLDVVTGAAIPAGTINYQTGDVVVKAWTPGTANTVQLVSLLTQLDGKPVDAATFRVPVSPLRPGSLQILATKLRGGLINVTATIGGAIVGPGIVGTVDYESGVVSVRFGQWVPAAGNEGEIWYSPDAVDEDGNIFKPAPVFADTIKYNAVGYTYLPLDANLLGIDPVRLPQDGRVVIFKPGGFVVVGHAKSVEATFSAGQTVNAGRVRLSRFRVIDADGVVARSGYTTDLEAGTLTFTDVSGLAQPLTVEDRIEDLLQVSDVQINGELAFTRQLTHNYPVGSYVSSALIAGDLRARVSVIFDQVSWNNTWADIPTLAPATANYNNTQHPIAVTNRGAVTERWAMLFTSPTTFNVIGEHVGVIAQGNTGADTSPINPATGTPYFTLKAAGLGLGWTTGNVIRFNTVGALFPFWVARTIQQGPETLLEDSFTLLIRGDVDRPKL